MKPEFVTHSASIRYKAEYIRKKRYIKGQSVEGAYFSFDGCFELIHKKYFMLSILFDLPYILSITKPVLYIYPFHVRRSFSDFDAYFINLFWETEIFSDVPIPLSKATCQKLIRTRKPIDNIKLCDKEFKATELNQAVLYWFEYKEKFPVIERGTIIYEGLLNFIDSYNRDICSLYRLNYNECKRKAWLEAEHSDYIIKWALDYEWDKTVFWYE